MSDDVISDDWGARWSAPGGWKTTTQDAINAIVAYANASESIAQQFELTQFRALSALVGVHGKLVAQKQKALDAACEAGGRAPDEADDFRAHAVLAPAQEARYVVEKLLHVFGRECVMLGLALHEGDERIATAPDLPLQRPEAPDFVCASYRAHGGLGSVKIDLHATPHRLSFAQAKELYDALAPLVTRKPTGHRFAYSDGGEKVWNEWVEQESAHPYSRSVVDFAEAWACAMDKCLQAVIGAQVADIAEDAWQEPARTYGITGMQYGCAVNILSKVWKHGEALRRWHNLAAQVGDEGERANEAGGVLNPAVLSVGEKAD